MQRINSMLDLCQFLLIQSNIQDIKGVRLYFYCKEDGSFSGQYYSLWYDIENDKVEIEYNIYDDNKKNGYTKRY